MEVRDYAYNDTFDLIIANGDFSKTESTGQHEELLLLLNKGEVKQSPLVGVGLNNYILDNGSKGDFESEANEQFQNDGLRINEMKLVSWEDLQIDAEYIDEENNG